MNTDPLRVPRRLWCLAFALFTVLAFGLAGAEAAIDDNATRQIWRAKYAVSAAQLADASWLLLDSDGDGQKNGAEIEGGTDPFNASRAAKVRSMVKAGATVSLEVETEAGKLYQVEGATNLSGSWVLQPQPSPLSVIGDGAVKTLTVPSGLDFYRVRVSEIDTDFDGLSDWAERVVALNPGSVQTVAGVNDLAYVNEQLAIPNVVTIRAATPFASEDGPSAGKFTVTRTQNLFPTTVNLEVSGTALPGADYASVAASVTFPAGGSKTQDVFVNPIAQAAVKGGRSVTATLALPAAPAYPVTLGTSLRATVIINSSTVPTGTGLLARYYDHYSSTYASAVNFGQAGTYAFTRGGVTTTGSIVVSYPTGNLAGLQVGHLVKLTFSSGPLSPALYNHLNYTVTAIGVSNFTVAITAAAALPTSGTGNCNLSVQSFPHPGVIERVEAGVNGDWQSGTPNGVVILPNNSPENYSASWETYLSPTTAGNYTFQLDADDKARVWLDSGSGLVEILEHGWNGPATVGAFKQSAPIFLDTGTPTRRYRLRVEHVETTGDARCRLQWKLGSGTFANIPQANQFTQTEAMTYGTNAGVLTVTLVNPHSLIAGQAVNLWFSTGGLFSPTTYNGSYTVATIPTANTFTVNLAGAPATTGSGFLGNAASATTGVFNLSYANINFANPPGRVGVDTAVTASNNGIWGAGSPDVSRLQIDTFSVRWSGQMQPQFSEDYTINVLADDGCRLLINGQPQPLRFVTAASVAGTYSYTRSTGLMVVTHPNIPAGSFAVNETVRVDPTGGSLTGLAYADYVVTAISGNTFTINVGANLGADATGSSCNIEGINKPINDWFGNGTERYVRLPLVAGVRYDITLEYFESGGAARCFLYWYSASQPKQIIPANRLYPSSVAQAPASHVSPTETVALVGGPFSYVVGSTNGATVTVAGNPAWLTLTNGILSGTPPVGSAGDYQIVITTTNAAGTSTSVLDLHVEANAGTIVREHWSGVSGTELSAIPLSTVPSGTASLNELQAPTNFGDNYGARLRGYITAPETGNYYFWIAGSDAAELWIANDDEPINAFKRAWVSGGSATPLTWNAHPKQKTPWLALEQGKKYYFEILHKAGVGTGDNLAIGWLKPNEIGTVPSQVVPGYVLSPYVAPAPGSTPGTLYVATLLAQNGALTKGVGSSTLRVSEDGTSATMRYTFSGLTGPITSQHIHADPYLSNPAAIVYDIDTPVTPGDGLQADGSYKWTITGTATLTQADIVEIVRQGKAYINLHTAAYPNGEIRGNYTLANGSRSFTPPPAPPAWSDDHTTDNGAVRFLTQATFGANVADIQALKTMASYEAWIDNQFGQPATLQLAEVLAREVGDVFQPFDDLLTSNTWWKNAITAPDQLRQRVAFALSQIHVLSAQGPLLDNARALSHFYDSLTTNAFGNFRDLLVGTTLAPGMGRYLDMLRNDKPDLSVGRIPNENYGREIKQLFSIGLYRMWPDGNLMLDSQDLPVETYSQREIVGFAHVFTGWDYGYDGAFRTTLGAASDWTRPMREVPARHFTGPKRILNNEVLPGLLSIAGLPLDPYATHNSTQFGNPAYQALPAQELGAAHDQLFNHANVGPFICRQLIQRLVTSHPSRGYLYRVVQKFENNGAGVRGDMKAVIKAILLDYEARSGSLIANPAFGKQREPINRITAAARAFRPQNLTGTYAQSGTQTITITTSGPHLLAAGNSVFLDFTDGTTTPTPAPSNGTYTVVTVPTPTSYTINAPGWMTGNYSQVTGASSITVTMSGHWLPAGGQAYFDFLTATTGTLPTDGIYSATTSTSVDFPGGSGNASGTTFTIPAPNTTARTGTLMICRFPGSYAASGGALTIDTFYGNSGASNYGTMADHHLTAGANVYLNFFTTRDTTNTPSTTANDLVYPVVTTPDANTFTVTSAATMNSDNGVYVFPLQAQPRTRNGSIVVRTGTFNLGNTDSDLAQTPLNSATVFNFFLPDYKFPGALASQGLTTPEFQVTAETTVVRQANFITSGLFNPGNTSGLSSFKSGSNALVLDFSPWMSLATDMGLGGGPAPTQAWTSNSNLDALIQQMNTLLMAGQLGTPAKDVIKKFLYRPITSIGVAASNCPVTSVAHGLVSGDTVTISGVTGGTYNKTVNAAYVVTVTGVDTFTIPVTCTVAPTAAALAGAHCSPIAYTDSAPSSTHKRDRLRAILHLLLTSPDFTIQR